MQLAPTLLSPATADLGTGWSVVRAADTGAGWHPHIRTLLFYWYQRCTADRLPSRAMIDPADLPNLLPHMWMLDVQRAPWRFRYRLAGTGFTAALGRDVTHRWYDEVRPLAYTANRTRLITVARDGVPTWRRGPMPIEDENGDPLPAGWQDVENLMLPLAGDGINVDIVMGLAVPYLQDGAPAFRELAIA